MDVAREPKLRKEFLDLLEKDAEFRYTVAGYLGIAEILRRLDRLEENITKLWEEVKSLRESQEKLWRSQRELWEEVRALRENQEKLWEEVRALRENQEKLWEEVRALRENQEKLWEEVRALREDYRDIRNRLDMVTASLEHLTLSIEEEAREVVGYRLRKEMGVQLELAPIIIDKREIDLYGASGDLCVIGEATVRFGVNLVDELERKLQLVKEKRPDLLRPKMIKLIYTMRPTPEAVEKALSRGVWVLSATRDFTPRSITSMTV
ncbi:MAG: hypothetical protein QFX33_00215 [Candidatus Nezhaarchaeota archaeon]|nr:hypothetical protein [Candidatus Nezhaarchaeota archaeon]